MRLTASALSRAEACVGSCVLPAIPESGDYAATGQAVDDYIRIAKTTSREAALQQAPAEMRPYLAAIPLEKIPDNCEFQVAFAYNCLTGEVRRIASRMDGYPDMPPEWIFGSLDIVGRYPDRVFIQDIKWGVATIGREPEDDLQLGFQAMAAAKWCGLDTVEVGFLRIGWDASATPDMVMMDEWALAAAEERVRGIWRRQQGAILTRRGFDISGTSGNADIDGQVAETFAPVQLSVGSHCTYCPARRACPAQVQPVALALAGRIDELAGEVLPAVEVLRERVTALALADKGRLYERLEAVEDFTVLLKGILRDDARLEPLPLSGGKELREVQWGSSQKSPVAQAELAALTEDLKRRGEIKTVKVAQIRPMKARS